MTVSTAQAVARLRAHGVMGPLTAKFVEDCRLSFEFSDLMIRIAARQQQAALRSSLRASGIGQRS